MPTRRNDNTHSDVSDMQSQLTESVCGPGYGPSPVAASSKKKRRKAREARTRVHTTSGGYVAPPPPQVRSRDSIDNMVSKVDLQDDDKYRTPVLHANSSAEEEEGVQWSDSNPTASFASVSQLGDSSYYTTDAESKVMSQSSTEGDPEAQRKTNINDLYQMLEEADYYHTKQKFAYLAIGISATQLLILALQLSLCGVAPFDVNPMVGTYPDALSQWGGKNAYLMQHGEWWRLVTPAFLHVGVLQLLVNAAVQLETCAFFEREWGSMRYLWIYLISSVGYSITASVANPDSVGVGSSGAIMGLFGAKLAQVFTQLCFDFSKREEDSIRLEQLSSVLCSLSVILALSFFTYIDWSGHMGAMATGYLVGMISFSRPIRNKISRTIWRLLGIILLLTLLPTLFYYFIEFVEPDEDLGNTCEYFRNLYAEGYECSCFVF